ncbi:MAG: PilZ domain-containing protein [Desulfobacterales bacterium]|nr:PilZ domain-containing protein [Desulfobacterales bacterium]MCP4159430.1 PilZ domain-containing protein [Deltaproteobacteria bacterium]
MGDVTESERRKLIVKFESLTRKLSDDAITLLLDNTDEFINSDKRIHEREEFKTEVDYRNNNKRCTDFIQNFSPTGVYIETTENIKKGTILEIAFKPPGANSEINIKCFVARIDEHGVGVSFINDQPEIAYFKGWLAGQSKHLATHSEDSSENGGYCYTRPNGYDYSGKMAYPVSVEKAFQKKWITFDSKTRMIGGHTDWAGLRFE